MNTKIVFVMALLLVISQINSVPVNKDMMKSIEMDPGTGDLATTTIPAATTTIPTTTTPIPAATTTIPTTTTTITTTTTTTTLAPEVDRQWEDLVLGGPTVVNYLGLFMVLASRRDQALTPPSEYTIKYIQNIGSLQATLHQVSSAMQNTFHVVSTNLVRIRNSMEQIPKHLNATLLIIKSVPADVLSTLLPYTLENLNLAAIEGSTVSKPTLASINYVGLLLEELALVIPSTPTIEENADYLIEAKAYADDVRAQWKYLEDLFEKFSNRADITGNSIATNFIGEISQALNAGDLNTQPQRQAHLNKLVPIAIQIDQSSYLLHMMSTTYSKVSTDYIASQIASSTGYLSLSSESARSTSQRKLWKDTVSQSVNVARHAQTNHNDFVGTGPNREREYAIYFEPSAA